MRNKLSNYQTLQHILQAILEIESFIKELSYDDYLENRMVQHACARNLEIIGEASNHLSNELKQIYNTINWRQIKDFRNVLVHEYFNTNTKLVWQIMQTEMVTLQQVVEQALKDLEEANNSLRYSSLF